MKRLNIFYVFSDCRTLEKLSGDRINEFNFLKALCLHHNVFYNGLPISPEDEILGNPKAPVKAPSPGKFDLHIVRANHELFHSLPSPKITMAYPYDEKIFREADALLVTTDRWKELLEVHDQSTEARAILSGWYPDSIVKPKRILNISQIPSFGFKKIARNHTLVRRYRMKFTSPDFCLGYFGRIDGKENLDILDQALQLGRIQSEGTITVIGTRYPFRLSYRGNGLIYPGAIANDDMVYALNATDLLLGGEDPANEYLGSRKILEALACGIPIMTRPWSARMEQLGTDYPLYFCNKDEFIEKVRLYRTDGAFRELVQSAMEERKNLVSFEMAAESLAGKIASIV